MRSNITFSIVSAVLVTAGCVSLTDSAKALPPGPIRLSSRQNHSGRWSRQMGLLRR